MAWSWSHTQEAYNNAEANLRNLPRKTLVEIYAEWYAVIPMSKDNDLLCAGFDKLLYDVAVSEANSSTSMLTSEELAEFIWERASEQATCDNGGYNAWMCPYGCGSHCVSFDRERTRYEVVFRNSETGDKWTATYMADSFADAESKALNGAGADPDPIVEIKLW